MPTIFGVFLNFLLRGITLTHIQDTDDQMAAKSKTQVISPGLPTTPENIT